MFWAEREPSPRFGHLYERNRPATPESSCVSVAVENSVVTALTERLESDFRSFSLDLSWTTTLLTCTAAYVHRISGATQFALGVPIHNRETDADRGVIGPLVDVFPVDVLVETDDTFHSLHRRVSRSLNRTLRYARPGTAPSGADIEAVVNVIPEHAVERFGSFDTSSQRVHAGAADSNHLLRVQFDRSQGFNLSLDLNHRAVDRQHHQMAVGHFGAVLEAMSKNPEALIGTVDILGARERSSIEAWGQGSERLQPTSHIIDSLAAALDGNESIVLESLAENHVAAPSLTGNDLWRWVNHVAASLQRDGVEPSSRVAVEMHRSADAVVALLAIARLRRLLCTDRSRPAGRPSFTPHRTSRLRPDSSVDPRAADRRGRSPRTGRAVSRRRGIPALHLGLDRGTEGRSDQSSWSCRLPPVRDRSAISTPGEQPVVPLFSALTFDLTVTSLFLPLVAGGRMIVVEGDGPTAVRRGRRVPRGHVVQGHPVPCRDAHAPPA